MRRASSSAEATVSGVSCDLHRVVVPLVDGLQQLVDRALHGLWGDPVLGVVGGLPLPAPLGLPDGRGHGRGHPVGVHDDLSPHVPGGPARRLDERGAGAQVALLVGVQDGHQGHLGDVEPLPEQVDADQAVELAEA